MEPSTGDKLLSDKSYSALKWVALYLLPAMGAFYFTVANIWGLPNVEQVMGTLVAFNIFLSTVLGLVKFVYDRSVAQYDGTLDVKVEPDSVRMIVDLGTDPSWVERRGEIKLKVNKH